VVAATASSNYLFLAFYQGQYIWWLACNVHRSIQQNEPQLWRALPSFHGHQTPLSSTLWFSCNLRLKPPAEAYISERACYYLMMPGHYLAWEKFPVNQQQLQNAPASTYIPFWSSLLAAANAATIGEAEKRDICSSKSQQTSAQVDNDALRAFYGGGLLIAEIMAMIRQHFAPITVARRPIGNWVHSFIVDNSIMAYCRNMGIDGAPRNFQPCHTQTGIAPPTATRTSCQERNTLNICVYTLVWARLFRNPDY
jgi:hypothetical protein